MKKFSRSVVALAVLSASPVFAATQYGDNVRLSGFGTLGVVTSDNDESAFVRDGAPSGATRTASWKVDSKLGMQVDVKATSWLSATLQVLAEQRYEPKVTADFEWAFVKLTPVDGLNVRLGRIAPALFMASDSRNVGYANTTVRMPNEVYSLAGLKRMKGGDVSYRFNVAGTSLTVAALAGESQYTNANITIESKQTRGVNAIWETDFGTFRIGHVKTKNHVPDFPVPGVLTIDPYTFSGVGYQLDNGKLVIGAEYVKRKSEGAPDFVNSDGWYLMGGWHFDNLLPYAFAAETKPKGPLVGLNGKQTTYAVGVRWDLVSAAAVKLQFESVDPKGTMGVSHTPSFAYPARKKSNVLSLAVDFVF
jgi:hypothetical protein